MNQNDEKYILQKYMVAVAIAIIRRKPSGQPLEEYVNDVRKKFKHRDIFEDVSISDSDFADCDDDVNVVNSDNESEETLEVVPENNVTHKIFDELDIVFDRDDRAHSTKNINERSEKDGGITANISTSILNDINNMEENHCQELAGSTSIKEVLDIFKDIDKISDNKVYISTSTPKDAQMGPNSETHLTKDLTVDNEITFCSFGDKNETDKMISQETELYDVHGYTDIFTHISQSQDINIVIPNRLFQNHKNIINYNNIDSKTNEKFKYTSLENRNSDDNGHTKRTEVIVYNSTNTVAEYSKTNAIDLDALHTGVVDVRSKKLKLSNNSITKSSDEYSYLFTDILNDDNSQEHEETHNKGKQFTGISNKSIFSSTSLLNELELDSDSLLVCNPKVRLLEQNKPQNVELDVRDNDKLNFSDNQFVFSSTESESQCKIDIVNRNDNTKEGNINVRSDGSLAGNTCKCGQLSSGYETQCASRNMRLDQNDIEERSDAEAPEEIVTFKIVEDLNRVKIFLHRQEKLSDSGRSFQGSQLSSARINESGFCLLNYLVEYPLIERNFDIAEEVSKVLGEFVDKLHDDENYPQFVEKILEKSQELVKDIYEEDRTADLLKKEDQMNRLLLLNRSVNVTKYTIEKILPILQEVHTQLQKKDYLELCLVKAENLCYVLHMLEVLLKRCNAATLSQASTQPSQDDEKSLKRSTITEIWRKKWNLSKSDVSEGSFKKKCVLTQTSEILNKIIVEGIDGYSLIAYAALQCFNLLQS